MILALFAVTKMGSRVAAGRAVALSALTEVVQGTDAPNITPTKITNRKVRMVYTP
jgi:hypothetical protein